MDLSVKEKYLIVILLVTLGFFGDYFIRVFAQYRLDANMTINLGALFKIIICLVIAEIVIHSFFAFDNDSTVVDERDKLIEKVSYRNGYWVMSIGVWFLIGQIFIAATLSPSSYGVANWLNEVSGLVTPFVLANLLLFIFIVSEVTIFVTQLFHYRRGI